MDLAITTLKFNLMALEDLYLPEHPGSTFRGAFGRSLREISCSFDDKKCKGCNLKDNCPYSLFFNPFLTEKDKLKTSKRFRNKLRPFIFNTDNNYKKQYSSGEELTFKIRIFGYMKQFIPYVIESWKKLQQIGLGSGRSNFLLKNIWSENDLKGKKTKIFDYKDTEIKNINNTIYIDDIKKEESYFNYKVTLLFKTPTLIKVNGKYIKNNLEFSLLMRTLFRRLSTMAAFYGEEMSIYFNDYLNKAEKIKLLYKDLEWNDWYRYSDKQNKKIEMQGFTGAVSYEGEIADFLPYLIYAQYLNLGKNTVFGQGNFELLNY
ncbi:CRISPR system precrRNA processing endoribonuclease RAMP protein Cas6 [Halanaerobium sp. MA284_MarDTE_T2]|uniref:CRISPR system precrRNA processing endoribonuclease RAMP protein Cas6 n=1 Tax=Halanaerobium sp. MA284_MarDTE_T2 TaxID=2183913 RepID=UPI000E18C7A6|nr:CRISPR system precrRNA processing endoribonuclease RAMP protein Cas6 [Halanaerobium sp. MA284_MarDTE_T2]RCW49889.1 uncharacterized protein DUF2276 [Halanaerobium sp. MA284_MarDTE_T2]